MPEARVMLIHSATGLALSKEKRGDCIPEVIGRVTDENADRYKNDRHSRNYAWKLQVIQKNKDGTPRELFIRNDHHPQRCLEVDNGRLRLVDCVGTDDSLIWCPEFMKIANGHGGLMGSLVAFQNKASGRYLTLNGRHGLGDRDSWLISPMSWTSWTPGGVSCAVVGSITATAMVATAGLALSGAAAAGLAVSAVAVGSAATMAIERTDVASLKAEAAAEGRGEPTAVAKAAAGSVAGSTSGRWGGIASSGVSTHATVLCATAGVAGGFIAEVSSSLVGTASIDCSAPGLYVFKC